MLLSLSLSHFLVGDPLPLLAFYYIATYILGFFPISPSLSLMSKCIFTHFVSVWEIIYSRRHFAVLNSTNPTALIKDRYESIENTFPVWMPCS